ncbi:MAG: BamA/TamA family outer membrane protein [Bacteroidales bacterium]|nr:BamA/TamA family outer membrane protein [Bacteroidales bacterium]
MRRFLKYIIIAAVATALWACSTTKHVPQGEYLLDKVTIKVEDTRDVSPTDLYYYLRQTPNHKVLGCLKLQLMTYSLSGKDSTNWFNKWMRKLGKPPVIYDEELTVGSAEQLERAMVNRGYMDAEVTWDTIARPEKKKMDVVYTVKAGQPHSISEIIYDIPDRRIDSIVRANARHYDLPTGQSFDRTRLDDLRGQITESLRNAGYYSFSKENITFIADTLPGDKNVELTLVVHPPKDAVDKAASDSVMYRRYFIREITYYVDTEPGERADTVHYGHVNILYGADHYLNPKTLDDNCYLFPGQLYRTVYVNRTYEALGRLGVLRSVNIELSKAGAIGDRELLDVAIILSRNKKQGITFEVEGTNSEGDLGFGVGLTYQHRNLAHGSELLTTKLRTNYESLSGNVDGLLHNRYSEYAAEVGITFPKFKAPFLSREFKRSLRASTEFALSFNYQERPEYTRIIAGAAWKYRWNNRFSTMRHTFDLIDVNYVFLPHSTINFIDEVAPQNPLLRYSYEDHFIMRMGYSYYHTNRRPPSSLGTYAWQRNISTLRATVSTAGNLLYALSWALNQKREDGAYKIFGIQYAQYAKGEFEYTWTHNIDRRQSFALHGEAGIVVPYGNSRMVPFEKRFYGGGANGVRGWNVRALGPGSYDARNTASAFIHQCGDIQLEMSAEYRMKLFWVLEAGLFVDAGNIWTIHNYESQPGGFFRFDEFYKQIAAAYGVGLRFDFTYFLLRLDLGMKAHNPAKGQEPWPLIHPRWGRDATIHFAVGYPF